MEIEESEVMGQIGIVAVKHRYCNCIRASLSINQGISFVQRERAS